MRRTPVLPILMILMAPIAQAQTSGQTSNGCTYKVINGEYLYDCKNTQTPAPAQPSPPPPTTVINEAPVTSYSAAPMASQSERAAPTAVPTMSVVIAPPAQGQTLVMDSPSQRSTNRDEFIDSTYIGALVGGSTITATDAGSSVGAGLSVGTNIDDYLGIELAYSYTKQDLFLNLAARGGSAPASNYGIASADSTVSAHLLSAEIQFHLTDSFKRLRPYAGLGLGWKQSTLEESKTASNYAYGYNYNNSQSSGSLSQSSVGILGSLGTKFRFTKNWQGIIAMRYFVPVSSQKAQRGGNGRLDSSDSDITSSSLYQIVGGLQYAF